MNLYLVRHGESRLNQQEIHQNSSTPLSKEGIQQAHRVAKRLREIPADIMLSSPFERAKQTAEIIAKAQGKSLQLSSLFVEIKRPTIIEGKMANEPEVVKIKEAIMENWHDPNWKFADEETFYQLKKRALNALEYVISLKKENVIVITHGEFIRMLFSVTLYGEQLQAHNFKKIRKALDMNNTGITQYAYRNNTWKLHLWNDHAHVDNA